MNSGKKPQAKEPAPITPDSSANGQPAGVTVPREVAVKALLERGKKQGHLTFEEVAAVSAAYDEEDPEKGNELVEEIMGQGIEITEMPDLVVVEEDEVAEPAPVVEPEVEVAEIPVPKFS